MRVTAIFRKQLASVQQTLVCWTSLSGIRTGRERMWLLR